MTNKFKGKGLIFLVGCPRSGTTYLQKLLASHSQIITGQESRIFSHYIGPQVRDWEMMIKPENTGRGAVGLGCYLSVAEFYKYIEQSLSILLQPIISKLEANIFFVEKTPYHALYLKEIIHFLPEAKILHLVRDPQQVISSILSASQTWGSGWAPSSIELATQMWLDHVESVNEFKDKINEHQFYELRYEDLLPDGKTTFTQLLESFLQLDTEESNIDQIFQLNTKEAMQKGQGFQIPIWGAYAKQMGTHHKDPLSFYGDHKNQYVLNQEEIKYILSTCAKYIKQYDY